MKEKFRSYSFWMSVTAAVILVVDNVGKMLGFSIENQDITKIVDSICGVLILFGILKSSHDLDKLNNDTDQDDINQFLSNEQDENLNAEQNKNIEDLNKTNNKKDCK